MRGIAFAVLLMGCATPPPPSVAGQGLEFLTAAQMEQALEGRAMCVIYPEDGECETIGFLETRSGNSLVFRDFGANDIHQITTDALAGVVRSLQMFPRHDELFRQLDVERAQGQFRYLKTVTTSRSVLSAAGDRWCTVGAPNPNFERMDFYFSNNLDADTSTDVRLSPERERSLRAFLHDLSIDEEFRSLLEQAAPTPIALAEIRQTIALMAGAQECWSYSAIVRGGRLDLTNAHTFVGGQPAPHLDRTLRTVPRDAPPTLRAN